MHMLSRLREVGAGFIARHLPTEAVSITAEIPGSTGPLWQLRLNLDSTPQADGQLLRLRAHWRLSLRRLALPPPNATPTTLPEKLGRWIEQRTQSQQIAALVAPLLDRDVSSWMELRASDAALDEGSQALIPDQLAELGVQPRADQPVQSWAGEFRGVRPGFGVLSLLRLDKRQLPVWLQRRLGHKPFQMAATVATAIEDTAL